MSDGTPTPAATDEPDDALPELPLAAPGRRVLARAIDVVVLVVISQLIFNGLGLGDELVSGEPSDPDSGALALASLLVIGAWIVWDPVPTRLFGGTPTKLALGLRVVRAGDGAPIGWKGAALRWLVPGVCTLLPVIGIPALLLLGLVSTVFVFTRPTRQAVWDLAAKTVVVGVR